MGYTTKNLREYRMEQGLSLSELSYKAQVTANQISLLEKQKIKRPQAATIRKLAEALSKPITDFIEKEEN
jgi:transcriptional regulator with XRE-family HTH domain